MNICLAPSAQRLSRRAQIEDLARYSEGSNICLSSFTSEANPYLFPLDLLDFRSQEIDMDQATISAKLSRSETADQFKNGRWWLIHTKPRQEKRLADELRQLKLAHYLPVTKCKALTRGRSRVTLAPQFPGYLFLWGNDEQRVSALKTNRVVAIHPGGDSSRLDRQLWDLADLIEKGVPLRIEERLAVGRHVRVKAGVLKDKQGIIMQKGGQTRLFIFVADMLGGVSLEIEQHLLEPY